MTRKRQIIVKKDKFDKVLPDFDKENLTAHDYLIKQFHRIGPFGKTKLFEILFMKLNLR